MWVHDENGLLHRREVLDSGVPRREFDAAVADGRLISVGRGVCIDAANLAGQPRWKQDQIKYRYACMAAADGNSTDQFLSHQSAAALHGLSTLDPDRKAVHFSTGKASGGAVKRRHWAVHASPVPDDDVVEVTGVRVTSLARTAIDVALASDFKRALAVFDAALKMGVERDDLDDRLKRPRRGVAGARFALKHANKLAANPGESWCRAQIIEAGLPTPVLQREYWLRSGKVAYVDLDFDGRVVVEFDGFVKYSGEYLGPGQAPSDVVIEEKVREDGLRDLGVDVVRAVVADLRAQATASAAGRRAEFTWVRTGGHRKSSKRRNPDTGI